MSLVQMLRGLGGAGRDALSRAAGGAGSGAVLGAIGASGGPLGESDPDALDEIAMMALLGAGVGVSAPAVRGLASALRRMGMRDGGRAPMAPLRTTDGLSADLPRMQRELRQMQLQGADPADIEDLQRQISEARAGLGLRPQF